MKKEVIISISVAAIFSTLLLWIEYKCDVPTPPYTTAQYLQEGIIWMVFLTTSFSVIFYGIITGVQHLVKKIRRPATR